MDRFGRRALYRLLMGAALLAAPAGVHTQARAQEAISPYICLSNSCFMPSAPGAQGSVAGRPGVRAPAPSAAPARAAALTPQAVQQLQASLQARLLENLTDEQRATARLTPTIDGDRVGVRVEFTNPDGTPGRRSITVNPSPFQPG
jgi:hypothetical protein